MTGYNKEIGDKNNILINEDILEDLRELVLISTWLSRHARHVKSALEENRRKVAEAKAKKEINCLKDGEVCKNGNTEALK
ncbi:hypothetical protein G9A89_009156 [Geosiphon pyriformis]|nr:hypothetical protein G9A89_009156 [Geosiphon pyriformis]